VRATIILTNIVTRIRKDLAIYLEAHQNKTNQKLHYFAFLFAFLGWIFIFLNLYVTLILAFLHYLFSWIGHFFYERNKPASFKYPIIGFYIGFTWFFMRTIELISNKKIMMSFIEKE